jgi:putative phage-type endonuclease
MGTCDFKDAHQLWCEKTGKKEGFKGNYATKRGKDLEPHIWESYIQKTGAFLTKPVLEYSLWPVLSASLDGWDHSSARVVEFKATGKEKHQMALSGLVPRTYADQLQSQMLVSNAKSAHYVSFNPEFPVDQRLAIVEVLPDSKRQSEILAKAKEFWTRVQNNQQLDGYADQPELFWLLKQREEIKEQLKALESGLESIDTKIKESMKADHVTCDKYEVFWSERQGNVDYAKIPELKTVDLEMFRKKPSKVFNVKLANQLEVSDLQ